MNIDQAKDIVISIIQNALEAQVNFDDSTPLIGNNDLLDSMKLVEVCLALEDAAEESGFEFNWTSDVTMSKSRSMFRSVSALAEEFAKQSETV